jgi:hypothetical protein
MGDGLCRYGPCVQFAFNGTSCAHIQIRKQNFISESIFEISLQTIGIDINYNANDIRITPIVNDVRHSLLTA